MGATCGAGIGYLSGAPEFIPMFSWVRVARSLVFCGSLFVGHCIVCSSIYGFLIFGIFKLFIISLIGNTAMCVLHHISILYDGQSYWQ